MVQIKALVLFECNECNFVQFLAQESLSLQIGHDQGSDMFHNLCGYIWADSTAESYRKALGTCCKMRMLPLIYFLDKLTKLIFPN